MALVNKRSVTRSPEGSESTSDASVDAAEQGENKDDNRESKRSSSERPTSTKANKPTLSERMQSSVHSVITGTMHTFHLGKDEVREKRRQRVYEPTHHWWEVPLSAWIPEYNREILLLLFAYNAMITVLSRFTNMCGRPSDNDVEIHTFCSDDYILLQDKALTGFAVGMFLLLAFRANQAYDRFWEGRKSWGRLREVSRDFARLVCMHVRVESDDDIEDRRRAINFLTAFGAAVKLHLRKERDIRRDIEGLGCGLSIQDIANIQHSSHMPLFCLDIMSDYLAKQVRAGKLSDYQLGVLNTTVLAVMSDKLGSCERLNNTPIPLSYVLQLRFFLVLWLLLYPLHVVPFYGWWTILFCDLVAFAVLGIESMACEIENPFGYDRNDLDLDAFVSGFYNDTQEILHRAEHHDRDKLFDRKKVMQMSVNFHNSANHGGEENSTEKLLGIHSSELSNFQSEPKA